MAQLRTIQKQICGSKNPKVWSVLISHFRSVLHSTFYSTPMYCLMVRDPSLRLPSRNTLFAVDGLLYAIVGLSGSNGNQETYQS